MTGGAEKAEETPEKERKAEKEKEGKATLAAEKAEKGRKAAKAGMGGKAENDRKAVTAEKKGNAEKEGKATRAAEKGEKAEEAGKIKKSGEKSKTDGSKPGGALEARQNMVALKKTHYQIGTAANSNSASNRAGGMTLNQRAPGPPHHPNRLGKVDQHAACNIRRTPVPQKKRKK
ncbi:hypothetical protein niasHT_031992 [Heterodera trifolii]|uniref:Uncharacterized protein n=1 Tax=Heterodera trifolii TaxID=157864 RepID=A0ABD2IEL8_9BILA